MKIVGIKKEKEPANIKTEAAEQRHYFLNIDVSTNPPEDPTE